MKMATGYEKEDQPQSAADHVKEIETFVFFDLETTGFTGNPRILELSMIAVSRKDILSMTDSEHVANQKGGPISPELEKSISRSPSHYGPPKLPRVVHKYTRLYYPKALVHPNIEEVTGLSNYLLEHLSQFSPVDAASLKNFLNLPPPVCLLAHNGDAFDFPILKAELLHINSDILNGIICADTLLCARELETIAYKAEIKAAAALAENFSDSDFDDETFVQSPKKSCISPLESNNTSKVINYHTPQKSVKSKFKIFNDAPCCSFTESENAEIDAISKLATNFSDEDSDDSLLNDMAFIATISVNATSKNNLQNDGQSIYLTPEKYILKEGAATVKTPVKNGRVRNIDTVTPEQTPVKSTNEIQNNTPKKKEGVKRTLAYGSHIKSKTPFSQPILYQRLFGTTYKAHSAEVDATALLQICSFYGNEFLKWADKNHKEFEDVLPRWKSSRKSFLI